jgi:hypothetical protein
MSLEPLTLVWAPIKGYPMWPSQIVDPAVCNNDKVLRAGKEGQLLVYYFGDHMFGWYPREMHGLKDFVEHYETFSVPKAGKTKLFQTALDEAEAEQKDLGAIARRWKASLTEEQIRSRKQAGSAAEASKATPAAKKDPKPKSAAPPKEPKAAAKSAPEPERTGFDVFRSNIGDSLDTNELSVYKEMWDAMTADRKQYYEDLARSGDKKDVAKKGGKACAPAAPPRKPPGAFQLYVAANKNLIRELGLSQKEFKIYMQGEWESASAAVRAPFEREAMEKMSVYQSKRTEWILANPEAGAALSDKEDDVVADAFSVGEVEPVPDDDPRNHDYCEHCGRGGELICCDGCPASYHPKCLPVPKTLAELPDHWFCHVCTASRGIAMDQKPSTADVKKNTGTAPAMSSAQQKSDLKRERHLDDDTAAKRAKSERDVAIPSGDKGRGVGRDGDSGVAPRQSAENGWRKGEEVKTGWGSRAPDNASTRERDTRAPEAARAPETSRHPPDSRLFISGVNCGMTERDLALEIKKFGKIAEQFRFKPGAAFVHVQMATAEDALRAMNGLKNYRFLGREPPLNVKIADPRPGPSGSDRSRDEVPLSSNSRASGSDLVPGMTRTEVEGVLRKLGFDRNTACLDDVRRLRDELNDLMRNFDLESSELTSSRSFAASKIEEEKNLRIREAPRHEEGSIRSHYQDIMRSLDIEVEEKREKARTAHRNAQTNWKRKRQSILGSHQVPCFIDQGLPPRDLWTTIDHVWAFLDRCAPPSEPRREREPPRPLEPPSRFVQPPVATQLQPPYDHRPPASRHQEIFNKAPPPQHYDDRPPPSGWPMPGPHHAPPAGYIAPPPVLPPPHIGYPHAPPPYPVHHQTHPGPAPYAAPPKNAFVPPPPQMHRLVDPYGQPPAHIRPPQAAPAFGGEFGSDDILAALSQLQGLMPAPPALPASSVDVDYNDIFNMMLKKD